jgi:hypothetical protein
MFFLLIAAAAAAQPELVPLKQEKKEPPPLEYTLSLKEGDWRVRVTLRPGEPQPGKLLELLFDVGRQKDGDASDPTPLNDGKLGLTLTGPGQRLRLAVHALGDAGVYGAHWTPSAKGLWTLQLAPWRDAGPNVSFQVGAGVPMPPSSQGQAVQSSRAVVAAGKASLEPAAPSVKQLMTELGKRWLEQADAEKPDPAALKAMAELSRKVKGHVPREWAKDAAEFDGLATDLAASLDKGALPSSETCLKCHVKFRDSWVADLSKWPEVKPWKR